MFTFNSYLKKIKNECLDVIQKAEQIRIQKERFDQQDNETIDVKDLQNLISRQELPLVTETIEGLEKITKKEKRIIRIVKKTENHELIAHTIKLIQSYKKTRASLQTIPPILTQELESLNTNNIDNYRIIRNNEKEILSQIDSNLNEDTLDVDKIASNSPERGNINVLQAIHEAISPYKRLAAGILLIVMAGFGPLNQANAQTSPPPSQEQIENFNNLIEGFTYDLQNIMGQMDEDFKYNAVKSTLSEEKFKEYLEEYTQKKKEILMSLINSNIKNKGIIVKNLNGSEFNNLMENTREFNFRDAMEIVDPNAHQGYDYGAFVNTITTLKNTQLYRSLIFVTKVKKVLINKDQSKIFGIPENQEVLWILERLLSQSSMEVNRVYIVLLE